MKTPITDRIAAIKARKAELVSKLSVLEAKAKTQKRKHDTRRKIVVGAAVLTAMEKDADLARSVRRILAVVVTRPQDKELLLDLMATSGKPNQPSAAKETESQASV